MFATRIGAFEAQLGQVANQILTTNRSEARQLGDIFPDLELDTINGGQRMVKGYAEEDPFLQDFLELDATGLEAFRFSPNPVQHRALAVKETPSSGKIS